ncbi:MAG: GspE/PulE family protein, partial [bacterium]
MNSIEAFREKLGKAMVGKPLPDVPAIVDDLFELAVQSKATDLHLTPGADSGLRLDLRIDGVIQPCGHLPQSVSAQTVARIKVLAGLLTYRSEIPQEGRISPDPPKNRPEVRVSTFPTIDGERAALRFLVQSDSHRQFSSIGLPESAKNELSLLLDDTSGMIIFTGPTGSGKTTTLYACLREIMAKSNGSRCVVTLEDPVESAIRGIAQTSLDRRAGLGLAKLVKSVMRQDPDVIAIGEIRDRATARAAFQATLTGHLLLTTMHAGDCVEVITRLMDMNIPPYVLRSGIRGILAQRLLRRLCVQCRVKNTPEDESSQSVRTEFDDFFEAGGTDCKACGGTGYHGRVMAVQWLDTTLEGLPEAISQRADAKTIRQLLQIKQVK